MGAIKDIPHDPGELRRVLESRRRELLDMLQLRVARIREHGADAPERREEDDDGSNDLDAAIADLATATLRRIDLALERLDAGEYGRCTACGRAIDLKRLHAMPFAVRCRVCEAVRETEEVGSAQKPLAICTRIGAHRQ